MAKSKKKTVPKKRNATDITRRNLDAQKKVNLSDKQRIVKLEQKVWRMGKELGEVMYYVFRQKEKAKKKKA